MIHGIRSNMMFPKIDKEKPNQGILFSTINSHFPLPKLGNSLQLNLSTIFVPEEHNISSVTL